MQHSSCAAPVGCTAHATLPLTVAALPAGKEYAINQLVLFLSIVSLECDWERTRTPQSDDLKCEWGPACPPGSIAVCRAVCSTVGALGVPALRGQGIKCQGGRALTANVPAQPLPAADLPTIYPADALIAMRRRKA